MDEIIIIYVALAVEKILPVFLKGNTSIIKLIIEADKIKYSDNTDISFLIDRMLKQSFPWGSQFKLKLLGVKDSKLLRTKIKEILVDTSQKLKRKDMLEATFTIKSNDAFHNISDEVLNKYGSLDSKKIFFRWNEWLKREIKKSE